MYEVVPILPASDDFLLAAGVRHEFSSGPNSPDERFICMAANAEPCFKGTLDDPTSKFAYK